MEELKRVNYDNYVMEKYALSKAHYEVWDNFWQQRVF